MKTLKMSLANIQGKMNRKEMKLIMAGYGGSGSIACAASYSYTGPMTCYPDAASASAAGANGWWCCNCSAAIGMCVSFNL